RGAGGGQKGGLRPCGGLLILSCGDVSGKLRNPIRCPMIMTPAEFEKFIVDETEKWANVIKFAGIKPVMRLVGTARRDQPLFTSMKARAGATLSRSQVETAHQGYLPA